jgi:hypothetical protein
VSALGYKGRNRSTLEARRQTNPALKTPFEAQGKPFDSSGASQGKQGGAAAETKKKQIPRSRCSFGMTAVLRWEENFPRAPYKARARPGLQKHEAQALVGEFQM